MNAALADFVAHELATPVSVPIATMAKQLAAELGGRAVLFYGSALRTGDMDGVLDFYVLTDRARGSLWRRLGMRWLWPDVSFHEMGIDGMIVRAKVATMPLATFEQATRGSFIDTTIWTRFVQPAALIWCADAATQQRVSQAIGDAAITAARFAAVLGPRQARARDYWLALFRETYRAEMRVEAPGREQQILVYDPARYDALLPIAWQAGGVPHGREGALLAPMLSFAAIRALTQAWMVRVQAGKALNIARLIKATFTFDGAARYGLWKVQRHTGISVALTPWREAHPVLAAPAVLWRVMRARAS
ncbi:hypothetical protein ACFOKI_04800 [Sphingomonas qilianensis]|uniref:Uncharacterized protein n=1 Tax=Sphingomonas qilianensis TaxID=1736690 RepID=A0ABU9XUJ4_9SPHN